MAPSRRLRGPATALGQFTRARLLSFLLVAVPVLAVVVFVPWHPPQPPTTTTSHAPPSGNPDPPLPQQPPPPPPPPAASAVEGPRAATFFPPPGFTLHPIPRINGTAYTVTFPPGVPAVSLFDDTTSAATAPSLNILDIIARVNTPPMTDAEADFLAALPGVRDALTLPEATLLLRTLRTLLAAATTPTTYLEFGCGGSTTIAAAVSAAASAPSSSSSPPRTLRIVSVDSSRAWLDRVAARLRDDPRLAPVLLADDVDAGEPRMRPRWVDVGPLGDWGRPAGTAERARWHEYCGVVDEVVARGGVRAGNAVVYVDGRWRVACALRAFLKVGEGAVVVVHDFWNRPEYFVVLEFAYVRMARERMAVLVRRKVVDERKMERLLEEYQWDYA